MKQPISSEPTVKPRPRVARGAKACRQPVLRAVDGAAVIAEQQAADRRDRDDGADKAHIRPLPGLLPSFILSHGRPFVGALSWLYC